MPALHILIMLHMPLSRELGGARVQLELAQQWQAQGHQIETFDLDHAFSTPASPGIISQGDLHATRLCPASPRLHPGAGPSL